MLQLLPPCRQLLDLLCNRVQMPLPGKSMCQFRGGLTKARRVDGSNGDQRKVSTRTSYFPVINSLPWKVEMVYLVR